MKRSPFAELRAYCRHLGCIGVLVAGLLAVAAHAAGTSGGGFGGGRIGGAGTFSGFSRGFTGPQPGSSVIGHQGTGFSIYSQQGVTRVIGEAPVSKSVLLPDGRRARVIGERHGGSQVFGATGNHRILGNPRLFGDHP